MRRLAAFATISCLAAVARADPPLTPPWATSVAATDTRASTTHDAPTVPEPPTAAPSSTCESDYLCRRPGTVPVVVESDGDALAVSVVVPFGAPDLPSLWGADARFDRASGVVDHSATRQFVCATPCTIYLAPGARQLHIGGQGQRESDEALEVGPTGTRVRYHAASQAGYDLGEILTWVGGGAAVLGALTTFDASGGHCAVVPSCTPIVPVALLVGGGVALGLGLPLRLANGTGAVHTSRDRAALSGASARARVRLLGFGPLPGGGVSTAIGGDF